LTIARIWPTRQARRFVLSLCIFLTLTGIPGNCPGVCVTRRARRDYRHHSQFGTTRKNPYAGLSRKIRRRCAKGFTGTALLKGSPKQRADRQHPAIANDPPRRPIAVELSSVSVPRSRRVGPDDARRCGRHCAWSRGVFGPSYVLPTEVSSQR